MLRGRSIVAPVVLFLALTLSGCGGAIGPLNGSASDIWARSYPLDKNGEVSIVNGNGNIDVEGVDGVSVEVRADRIAHGATDQVARDLLPRITIKEVVKPDFVSIETERIAGLMIGARSEVRYHVKAPKSAKVRATTTNGGISVVDIDGHVLAQTTNGGVNARRLGDGIEARSTNGRIDVQLAALGAHGVELRTVNGGIRLGLPEGAKATVSATTINGGINVSGLNLDAPVQSRQRLEGKLNGGGTDIQLRTTNGGIDISAATNDASSK